MEKEVRRIIEQKEGKTWKQTSIVTNPERIYTALAHDLQARYIWKAPYITRIQDRSNYDGTRTVTVNYDNDCRSIYIVA